MQKHINSNTGQSGQVGIIVILISAIILVVGLSIANSTIKENQSIVSQEDSARVFSTAESGIQQALGNIFQFESKQNDQLPAEFSFEDSNLNKVSIVTKQNFEGFVTEKNTLEIKIVDGETGAVDINWSKTDCSEGAANLLIGHYFLVNDYYNVEYYMVGNCSPYSDQNLISADASILNPYKFHYTLNINDTNNQSSFLRIFPLQRGSDINVNASSNLIANGQYTIISLAQMQNGSSAKAIEVKKSVPSAPSFMDFAVASGGSLEK